MLTRNFQYCNFICWGYQNNMRMNEFKKKTGCKPPFYTVGYFYSYVTLFLHNIHYQIRPTLLLLIIPPPSFYIIFVINASQIEMSALTIQSTIAYFKNRCKRNFYNEVSIWL